ncbi:MAG: hypothetical protein ACD_79C00993G0005 [uncultured bacterium]|nr:MAG: hypothetical protein ACD_79C00993G0005 [uncultured bacterium]
MNNEASLNTGPEENPPTIKVLTCDDDPHGGKLLCKGLQIISKISADHVLTGEDAVKASADKDYDVILMDLNLPGMSGITAMELIKNNRPYLPIIIITGHNEIPTAVKAIKFGAFDYLIKPLDLDLVIEVIHRAFEHALVRKKNEVLKTKELKADKETIIYSQDSCISPIVDLIDKIATSDAPVLILGESGTGKELFANMIHHKSHRQNMPFIGVNCAAIPHELIESEFFGHEKGSFTGASDKKEGLFSVANKGTLFLDEIGDMILPMQVKLLRTLESGEIRKVGGTAITHTDVRVIAATSKDLIEEVKANRFREDLFYRLNVINFTLPPLAKRKEDIPLMIEHFLRTIDTGRKKIKGIEPLAMKLFLQYDWPGNIRELKNTVERLVLLCESDMISLKEAEKDFKIKNLKTYNNSNDLTLATFENQHIQKVLELCKGNKSQTAKKLGITLQTLYNKLKQVQNEQL